MDKSLNTLEQNLELPQIRHVGPDRPLQWLLMGWTDMRTHLGASLTYGIFFALLGYLILTYASNRPYLFTAAISGFFLVGPIVAAGLYEISRRAESGMSATFGDSLRGLKAHGDSLMYFGLFLALALIAWERLSAILFALFYQGEVPDLSNFARDVFLSGDYTHFVVSYLVIGGVLAAVVFALSAVAIPMLMDRNLDPISAAITSARAVGANIPAMAVWAAFIVVLVAVGFATMMIGMIVLLPLLGHATWHAYRDIIE